jgi:hypothetical protein
MSRARSIGIRSGFGAALAIMVALAGCATAPYHENLGLPPVSIQSLQYYPFLVKGYQNSFPHKRIVVLAAADARSFKDSGTVAHQPYQGHPAIGVVLDRHGVVAEHLYGPDLGPLISDAIAQSAHEAGMSASTAPQALTEALKTHGTDYLLVAVVTAMWVVKQRGAGTDGGPIWFSAADVALEVTIYKPPFAVPFWQGSSAAQYDDPPTPLGGASPEDETEIYDQPGEVLSVAMTRAVAGIFRRDDLHTLVLQDTIPPH